MVGGLRNQSVDLLDLELVVVGSFARVINSVESGPDLLFGGVERDLEGDRVLDLHPLGGLLGELGGEDH